MKKSLAIFAMTSLGLTSAHAGYFDGVFADDVETSAGIEGVAGTEYEAGVTRVNNASAMNNIMKSLKYLKDNTAAGKFVDGTTATDAVFTGGNVGIGTDSPNYPLEIIHNYGNSDTYNAALRAYKPDILPGKNIEITVGKENSPKNSAGFVFHYEGDDNDNNRLDLTMGWVGPIVSMNAEANVGIGTTTPTEKLEVKGGSINMVSNDGLTYSRLVGDGGIRIYRDSTSTNGDNVNGYIDFTAQVDNSVKGRLLFDADDNTFRFVDNSGGSEVDMTVEGSVSASSFIGDGSQLTNLPSNGKFVDGTTATDAVFTGGNVGIGTDSPTKKLTINSTVPGDGISISEIDGENEAFNIQAYTNDSILVMKQAGNPKIKLYSGGDSWIDTSGNVGIGTTSPENKLHVVGNSTFEGATYLEGITVLNAHNNQREGLLVGASDNGPDDQRSWIAPRLGDNSNWNYAAEFGHHNNYGAWYFEGNVGIGTMNPSEKLEVKGAVKLADTANACDGDRVGAIKYDDTALTTAGDFLGCVRTAGSDTPSDASDDTFEWKSITGVVQ